MMYFILAFSLNSAMVPQRPAIMTILVLLILILEFPLRITNISKNKLTGYMILLLILDAVTHTILNLNVLKHSVYSIQYTILMLAIMLFCNTDIDILKISKLIFWTSFIGGPLIGLIQLSTGSLLFAPQTNDMFINTIITTVNNTNANYSALAMLICVFLSGYIYSHIKQKIYLISMIISIVCTVLTFSRTAIASLLFCLFLLIIKYNIKKKKERKKITIKKFIVFFVIFFGIIIGFDFLWNILINYLESSNILKLYEIKQTSTANLRFNQWIASVQVILNSGLKHFFFGFGENANSAMGLLTGYNMTSHNFIFGALSELGILGGFFAALIYITFFVDLIKYFKKINFNDLWIVAGALAVMLCYMMISIITWELLLIICLVDRIFIKYRA